MAASILDSIAALRVAYLLITPIENTAAFKLGLLDADGKTIRKAETSEEKNSTSMLHRLCWNLKRMIGIIPGGKTRIGSLAAAYLLMKEAVEQGWSEAELNEQCLTHFNELCEAECPELDSLIEAVYRMDEDVPANATGTAVSTNVPHERLFTMQRRKMWKVITLP
jgi:hypothetical protein